MTLPPNPSTAPPAQQNLPGPGPTTPPRGSYVKNPVFQQALPVARNYGARSGWLQAAPTQDAERAAYQQAAGLNAFTYGALENEFKKGRINPADHDAAMMALERERQVGFAVAAQGALPTSQDSGSWANSGNFQDSCRPRVIYAA